jgi:hypothetical protein
MDLKASKNYFLLAFKSIIHKLQKIYKKDLKASYY